MWRIVVIITRGGDALVGAGSIRRTIDQPGKGETSWSYWNSREVSQLSIFSGCHDRRSDTGDHPSSPSKFPSFSHHGSSYRGRAECLVIVATRGWTGREEIKKKYEFSSFPDAVKFLNKVADLAERADHHPDIPIN